MKNLILTFILMQLSNCIIGQINNDYSKLYLEDLYKLSKPIKSFYPIETNFDDLEAIGQSLGDKNIVLLGEPSHGDGGAILMKTRIVKYLHEKKGFNVLLFEADLFSILFGVAKKKDTSLINTLTKENIYSCWSESKVSEDLWKYYKEKLVSPNKIEIGGIDCRHAGNHAKNNLIKDLTTFLTQSNYNISSESYSLFKENISYILLNEFNSNSDSVDAENFTTEINKIEEAIKFNISDYEKRNLWLIEINNLKGWFNYVMLGYNRDAIMAQNFSYLLKYIYPNKKIIIWSHNNHNVLDVNTYASFSTEFAEKWHKNNTYQYFTYLGSNIIREFSNQVYSLAITSGNGNFSPKFFTNDNFHADFTKTATVPRSNEQSLEHFLESKKTELLFIPLPNAQGRPSGYPWFSARLFDLQFEAKMDYTSSFNGIIYINNTVNLNGQ